MPIEFVIFGCLTVSALLGCLVIGRISVPVTQSVGLRKRPDRSLATTEWSTRRLDDWIERKTIQSGVPTDAVTLLVGAAAVAILSALAASVGGLAMPIPIVMAMIGFGSFWLVIHGLSVRRQKQFVEHFPTAIDMMARSVQAGESFEEALITASQTVAEPVAGELKRLAQELSLGMQVSTCMDAFARRNRLTDVKIFANTVSIHRETGGRLADTLARLAEVIRIRSDYLRRFVRQRAWGVLLRSRSCWAAWLSSDTC